MTSDVRVDGMVRGNVAALPDQPSTLVISSDARVDGEVQAAHIVVNGTIKGTEYTLRHPEGAISLDTAAIQNSTEVVDYMLKHLPADVQVKA